MNNQITALAREYAEEMCAHMEDDLIKDEAIRDNELSFQMAVEHLSRRYCLVERSKVKQIYQAKQHILANQNVFGAIVATEASAEKRLMLCLFPEIAKEVE